MREPKKEIVAEPQFTKIYTINIRDEPELVFHREFDYFNGGSELPQYDGRHLYRWNTENYKTEVVRAEEIVTGIETDNEFYVQKELIIIEPRLEEIVAAKWKKICNNWKDKAIENESKYRQVVSDLENEKSNYNKLPWWKKMFTFKI